jgi:uncharacterized protein YjbI with pentapeptide repeats
MCELCRTRHDRASFGKFRLGRSGLHKCCSLLVIFWDSNCDECCFANTDLRGTSLSTTSLRGASFTGAKFSIDALGGQTDLSDVDFSEAELEDADLTDALYNAGTKFPAGFDPEEHGMKLKTGLRRIAFPAPQFGQNAK